MPAPMSPGALLIVPSRSAPLLRRLAGQSRCMGANPGSLVGCPSVLRSATRDVPMRRGLHTQRRGCDFFWRRGPGEVTEQNKAALEAVRGARSGAEVIAAVGNPTHRGLRPLSRAVIRLTELLAHGKIGHIDLQKAQAIFDELEMKLQYSVELLSSPELLELALRLTSVIHSQLHGTLPVRSGMIALATAEVHQRQLIKSNPRRVLELITSDKTVMRDLPPGLLDSIFKTFLSVQCPLRPQEDLLCFEAYLRHLKAEGLKADVKIGNFFRRTFRRGLGDVSLASLMNVGIRLVLVRGDPNIDNVTKMVIEEMLTRDLAHWNPVDCVKITTMWVVNTTPQKPLVSAVNSFLLDRSWGVFSASQLEGVLAAYLRMSIVHTSGFVGIKKLSDDIGVNVQFSNHTPAGMADMYKAVAQLSLVTDSLYNSLLTAFAAKYSRSVLESHPTAVATFLHASAIMSHVTEGFAKRVMTDYIEADGMQPPLSQRARIALLRVSAGLVFQTSMHGEVPLWMLQGIERVLLAGNNATLLSARQKARAMESFAAARYRAQPLANYLDTFFMETPPTSVLNAQEIQDLKESLRLTGADCPSLMTSDHLYGVKDMHPLDQRGKTPRLAGLNDRYLAGFTP